jgi:hypothetical protein
MKKELIKLANHLDRIGLTKEADYVDNLLKKEAMTFPGKDMLIEKAEKILAAAGTPISEAVIKYGVECAEDLTTFFPPHIPNSDEISNCVVKKLEENAIDIALDTVNATCEAIYKALTDLVGM